MRQYYKVSAHSRSYPANSEPPFHKVTHRHDKSIPGCTPAPRDGIYRPVPQDEAQAECGYRAELYNMDVEAYIRSEITKEEIFRSFNRPIFGAFGEKF